MASKIDFCKKGNAVGFTKEGYTIAGQYRGISKCWTVYVDYGFGASMTDPKRRNFPTKAGAIAYAETLIDSAKTAELKWW